MSEEPRSITKLCELMDTLKDHIIIVESELTYKDSQDEYEFRRKLSAKSEKIELVKKSLEALSLKANLPVRESKGRSVGSAKDSGYNSACSERRNALFLDEEDLPGPVESVDEHASEVDDSVSIEGGPERQCTACHQQIRTPMQVTKEDECTQSARGTTVNNDSSEI